MLNLRQVHVLKKVPGKQEWRLAEVHPAIRIGHGEEQLYLQNGAVHDAAGNEIPLDKVPAWFMAEAGKMSAEALKSVGLTLKEEKKG